MVPSKAAVFTLDFFCVFWPIEVLPFLKGMLVDLAKAENSGRSLA